MTPVPRCFRPHPHDVGRIWKCKNILRGLFGNVSNFTYDSVYKIDLPHAPYLFAQLRHWVFIKVFLFFEIETLHASPAGVAPEGGRGAPEGGQGGLQPFPVGEPSSPVGKSLTICRGMNIWNNMKLSNFDSSCLLVARHSNPPPSGNLAPVSGNSWRHPCISVSYHKLWGLITPYTELKVVKIFNVRNPQNLLSLSN